MLFIKNAFNKSCLIYNGEIMKFEFFLCTVLFVSNQLHCSSDVDNFLSRFVGRNFAEAKSVYDENLPYLKGKKDEHHKDAVKKHKYADAYFNFRQGSYLAEMKVDLSVLNDYVQNLIKHICALQIKVFGMEEQIKITTEENTAAIRLLEDKITALAEAFAAFQENQNYNNNQ